MPKPEPKKARGVYEHPKGSGVWWILYYANGRRRREKVGSRSAAKDLYQVRKAAVRLGQKLPDLTRKRVTFGELLDDVVAHTTRTHKSARDYRTKADLMRADLGGAAASDLSHTALELWIESRRVANATFNRYRAFLSLTFKLAMRAGKAEANPAKLMEHRRESRGRVRFLSREEVDRVLAHLPERRRAAVLVSIYSGMRLSEQFTLTWEQIDWKRKVAHLTKTKNGDERDVPLNTVVLAALRPVRREAGLVFPRLRGGEAAVQPRWYKRALAAVGVLDASWHTNRHTFCSWHAMAGTPLRTIQELAGHKTIAITMRYAHLCPDYTAREAERIVVPTATRATTKPSFAGRRSA